MRWLGDGTVRLSKNAPKLLQQIAGAGLLDQAPRSLVRRLPKKFYKSMKRDGSVSENPYDVKVDELWEDLDPRHSKDGVPRVVRVVAVGDTHAVVERIGSHARTTVKLSSFSGTGKKGYKRHGS